MSYSKHVIYEYSLDVRRFVLIDQYVSTLYVIYYVHEVLWLIDHYIVYRYTCIAVLDYNRLFYEQICLNIRNIKPRYQTKIKMRH